MRRPLVPVAAVTLLAVLWAVDAPPVLRAPLTAVVLLAAGGLALAPEAPAPVIVVVSLALDAVVATALLVVGAWSPGLALAGLGLVVCVGVGARLRPPIAIEFEPR